MRADVVAPRDLGDLSRGRRRDGRGRGARAQLLLFAAQDAVSLPALRLASWRASLPEVETDNAALEQAVRKSGEDLGALRIFDPEHPDVPILAAGAPWFMTVFGRDSLLTAWMTLIAEPSSPRACSRRSPASRATT